MTHARFIIAAGHEKRTDGRQAAALARGLVAQGHEAVLLRPASRGATAPASDDLPTIYWPSQRPTTLKDGAFLRRAIREHRPTHLVANFGAVNLMMLVGWLEGVPHRVCWYHTLTSQLDFDSQMPAWRSRAQRLRKRGVYRFASHIVANSTAARDDVIGAFGVAPDKVVVFPNFVADPLGPRVGCRPVATSAAAGPHVVCVGRLHRSKGQDVLLRALVALLDRHPKLRVTFLGGGPALEEYQQLANQLGVAHACTFAGGVARDEVLRTLAGATVAVVPSREEAFGFVNIEALAVGTPVVASRVGGIPDIVRDGMEGRLFTPGDHDALARHLTDLLADSELHAMLSRNARSRFLECYEETAVLRGQIAWLGSLEHERRTRAASA